MLILLMVLAVLVSGVPAGEASGAGATQSAPRPGPSGPVLRWGGDAEGGAPFVEADPNDPTILRGFDVEVAAIVAKALGRTPQFVQVAWASIDASVRRGDFDIGMSGVEDTPARRSQLAVTVPYFEFREVLTVRRADAGKYRSLADLRGRRVGTLGGTQAYELLLEAARSHGVVAVSYDDDVHPYTDLVGRTARRRPAGPHHRGQGRAPHRRPDHRADGRRRRPLRRRARARPASAARPRQRHPARRDARRPPRGGSTAGGSIWDDGQANS